MRRSCGARVRPRETDDQKTHTHIGSGRMEGYNAPTLNSIYLPTTSYNAYYCIHERKRRGEEGTEKK